MRRAVVLLISLLLLVGLAGRDGGTGSAQAAVNRAIARTTDVGSFRFTLSWQGTQPSTDPPVDYEFEGAIDYARDRGRVSFGFGSEIIFDGDDVYAKWSTPWRKEPAWLHSEAVSDMNPLDLQRRIFRDPIGLLGFLTGASTDVRTIGSEEVRGTRTLHYEGTLDLQRVVDRAPAARRAELQELLDSIREHEPVSIPFGLWIDRDGVARRLRFDQLAVGSLFVDYYDFGTPVKITPPAPSEIVTVEELMREMSARTGESDCAESDAGSDEAPDAAGHEFNPETEGFELDVPAVDEADDDQYTIGRGTAYLCLYEAPLYEAPPDGS